MKKLLISLILCCFALFGLAQEHLSFKGIPITGSMSSFCQKLKAKGFTQIGSEGNVSLFKGDFTGRKATVGAVAADNGKDIFAVIVYFDESDSWNSLVNTYEHYKDLYTEKYGSPIHCVENNPSRSDFNSSLMFELFEGNVTYTSVFETQGGTIQISIEKYNYDDGVVVISYTDAININAKRQSDLGDI